MERSPNILFLMTDEHRYDVAGFAGNTIVRTPTLDRLAADGVVFNNAYTPAPICVPGRQSMMAGQLPRTTGCLRFGQDLPPGHLTFARLFARHGYATVCAGKLHHQGIDQMQGWTHRIGADTILAPEFVENPAPEFAERAFNLKRLKWSDAKEVRRAGIGRSPWAAKDELALAGALDFIEEYFSDPYYDRATPERPLLLKISLNQPHYPYLAPKELFTYYLNRVEPFLDEPVFDHPFLSTRQVRPGVDASERDIRRATAAYYAMVENADAMFGRVIEALEHHGQSIDDWIVVYTSDHGEMLGQHGVWEKQKFFEASVRVPLIIRWPRRFGPGRVDVNVNLCDLYATLCELAGLDVPPGLDSRSMVRLMHGDITEWFDESVSHFGQTNLMIKRGSLKYQYYGEDMPEVLFDLARDPSETTNFLHDPAYADEVRRFRARRSSLGYGPDADPHYRDAGYAALSGA